tara:strand:+ start:1811 stop:2023 length:213 start_codon:yes stop_codon:yes gene_type:complete
VKVDVPHETPIAVLPIKVLLAPVKVLLAPGVLNINWYMIFIGLQEFCLDDYQLYINDGTDSIDKKRDGFR